MVTDMIPSSSKILIRQPSLGVSPSGFRRLHIEMLPREVGRLIGYDPRVLVRKTPSAKRATREILPHNVSPQVIALQNQVQRSIDNGRVAQMVDYLLGSQEREQFADWGAIELVTSKEPDLSMLATNHTVALEADADYFIADGQHRYCALLDFLQQYPQYAEKFTQSVTIGILPESKLVEWAGQEFHDRNYFSVPVRAGKALSVDTRDPVNALAREISHHPAIQRAGGIAYERDTLLANDTRFTSHSILHRMVRAFLFGRPGLNKDIDTRVEISPYMKAGLGEYLSALGEILPWSNQIPERDQYLTRASAVLSSLAVIGNDLYTADPMIPPEEKVRKLVEIGRIDWKRNNLGLVGVVGSEKNGLVQPASSRQAIDSTIRFIRERLGLIKA